MAAPETLRSPDKRLLAYRFAGVVLDLRRQVLRVDGGAVASTPLMLRLLRLLCEADGQLLKRNDVFDQLWPGGQEISDSSLSQLVWRLRGALGPYGGLITTLRGSGLRLDAAVTPEFDFQRRPATGFDVDANHHAHAQPAGATPLPVPHAAGAATGPTSTSRRRPLIGLLAALVVAATLAAWLWWPRNPLVNAGYGLHADDLQSSRNDTVALVTAALDAAGSGDRARGKALMRSIHEADPSTPLPALMLAWWASDTPGDDATPWLDAARSRLRPDTSPYLRLLADYFIARSTDKPIDGPLKALLDLRPQAWHLQFSLAHEQLTRRELAGALHSLQQIPLDIPDTAQVTAVLADRFALGDETAEAAARQVSAIATDPLQTQYLDARFSYSRGNGVGAVAAMDRCLALASMTDVQEQVYFCSSLGTLAAIDAGAADAGSRVEATARLCHELGRRICRVEMLGFEAFLASRSAQANRASDALARAWQEGPQFWPRVPLLLVALENDVPLQADIDALTGELPASPVFGGVAELLLAWRALAIADDPIEAGRLLALARERGVSKTYHAEDATLLANRLGEPAVPCRVDPPYPNMLRLTACILLRDAATRNIAHQAPASATAGRESSTPPITTQPTILFRSEN